MTQRAIRYPFRFGANGKIEEARSYDDIVRGQVIDALMTNQGERVFRPRYGCDIQSAVFDPADELTRRDAGALIKQRLTDLVQRAQIVDVSLDITTAPTIMITVSYRSSAFQQAQTLTVPVASEFVQRQLQQGVS